MRGSIDHAWGEVVQLGPIDMVNPCLEQQIDPRNFAGEALNNPL